MKDSIKSLCFVLLGPITLIYCFQTNVIKSVKNDRSSAVVKYYSTKNNYKIYMR